MKRAKWAVFGALAAGLAAGALWQAPAQAGGGNDLGHQVAGGYWLDAVNSLGSEFKIVANLHADGNFATSTSNAAFGNGDPDGLQILGNAGTWVQTGPSDILLTTVGMIHDQQGFHVFNFREHFPIEFDPGLSSASTTYRGFLYLPDQDPLDPNEVPLSIWNGTARLRRITSP